MAYGVYSDRGYREHILERNKNTNKTEVFTQEDQTFTGRKTFLSGVTTSDLEVRTVEVFENLKVKGKDITEIIDYLPNDVSKENKLTTKDFVNSSIATNTANFLGTFNTLGEIEALTDVTNNDYAFWKTTDTVGNVVFKRYKYSANEQLWKFEYDLNNSSFTAAQWDAINSGITEELVSQIGQGGGSALDPSNFVPSTIVKSGFKVVAYSDRTIAGNSKLECLENWITNAISQYGQNLVIIGNIHNESYVDGFATVNVWGNKTDGILGASGMLVDQEGMHYYKKQNGVPGSSTLNKIN